MPEPVIKLVVGLGNPGPEYQATRHNVGFWFVEQLAEQHTCKLLQEAKFSGLLGRVALSGMDLRLLTPMTFVNRSGRSVAAVAQYFDILSSQILVVHDELDLPCGQVRLKQGGGHAGHNGLRDIINALGTQDFWRVRIGIDRPLDRSRVVDYVLSRPDKEQTQLIMDTLANTISYLPMIITGQFAQAMNNLHTRR